MANLRVADSYSRRLASVCGRTVAAALQQPEILGAAIALYDSEEALRVEYAQRRGGRRSPFAHSQLHADSLTFQAVHTGHTVHVPDCIAYAPRSRACRLGGIGSIIVVPMSVADQTVGALVVSSAKRAALTAAHVRSVEDLAEKLGLRLANLSLQSRQERLQQLYEGLRASNRLLIGRIRSVDELYAQACEICIRNAGFVIAWIARPDEYGWFHTLAVAGPASGVTEAIDVSIAADRPEGQGSMGRAWREGQAAYLQAPRAEHRYGHWHDAFEAYGIGGFASVPLKFNQRNDAVLAVGAGEPDFFDEQERLLFEEIGIDLSEAVTLFDERMRTQIAAAAVQHAPTGIMVAEPETQGVIYSNPAMTKLTGRSRRELHGRCGLFFMPGDPTGQTLPKFRRSIDEEGHWRGLAWGRSADHVWEASVDVRVITGPDGSRRLLALYGPRPEAADVNLRDELTGLPNAKGFYQALQSRLDAIGEGGLVVARTNIQDLTSINSAYCRAGGDQILVDLAGRLRQSLAMSTLVARLDGDNFVIVTRSVRRDRLAGVAQTLLQAVEATVAQPFEIDDQPMPLKLATGVALYPGDAMDASGLLTEAETTLGQARHEQVRSRVQPLGHPETIRTRLASAARLKRALQGGHGIHPWYQPKICRKRGTLIDAEALARWQDAARGRGLVSPGDFLPLADALGLTTRLNGAILDATLTDLARWRAMDLGLVPASINLSGRQLMDEGLTRQLLQALEQHDLPTWLLHVEITEHDVITNVAVARRVLQTLDDAGILVSLDDFGTGYSSLSILRDLPLSRLKLDKSFVDRLPDDARSLKVAVMVIELAHELDMKVIAEGVESRDQAAALVELGCDYGQGFYFARPMPAADFRHGWLGNPGLSTPRNTKACYTSIQKQEVRIRGH